MKYVFILAALLIGMASMGQSVKTQENVLNKMLDVADEVTYYQWSNIVVTQADTLKSCTIGLNNNHDALKQNARIKLTENSGTAVVTVKVQAKVFWDDSYTDLLDVTYAGTGSDTTIVLDGTSAHEYRFYKILLDGDGSGTFNVTAKSEINFYK